MARLSIGSAWLLVLLISALGCAIALGGDSLDPPDELDGSSICVRRPYSFAVRQKDSAGRACWDTVSVTSCWGQCPSNEIADWRFPFKRSYHPVCQHSEVQGRLVTLRNCDEGVEPGTDSYLAIDAVSCRCQVCRTNSHTICESPQTMERLVALARRSSTLL